MYAKAGIKTYRLLAILLYGKHKWIDRKQDLLVIPNSSLTTHMKISAQELKQFLYQLENFGMIYDVRWSRNWLGCRMTTPVNMATIVHEIPAQPTEIDLDFDNHDYHIRKDKP